MRGTHDNGAISLYQEKILDELIKDISFTEVLEVDSGPLAFWLMRNKFKGASEA